ncbi:MAG: hypothetical protein ACRC7R_10885, partial [Sarcina sp.]
MRLGKETILFHRDEIYENFKIKNKNIRVVLLDEEIFVKVVEIKEKSNVDKLIKNVVNNTFYNYNVLVHYELIKVNKKDFLVVYFIRYYHKLRDIIDQGRNVEVIPIQFIKNINVTLKRNHVDVIIREFKNVIYLVIKINGVIFYGKNYHEDINIIDIKEGLNIISSYIDLKKFILRGFIDNKIFCE